MNLSPTEVQALINALADQRNAALNEAAVSQGKLAVANARIAELEKLTETKDEAPRAS